MRHVTWSLLSSAALVPVGRSDDETSSGTDHGTDVASDATTDQGTDPGADPGTDAVADLSTDPVEGTLFAGQKQAAGGRP